jgi:ferredoxin-like protein FixX
MLIKACTCCRHFFGKEFFYKERRNVDGLTSSCRKCRNKEALKWQQANPESKRNTHLKAKFNITVKQFNEMLQLQNFCCAICMSPTPKGRGTFHVDHCHETGKIRGILCHDCNTGIGKLGDSLESIKKAVSYLERFYDA